MDETTQSKSVKELSGGERSFTTLALLLALGESIESPFRGASQLLSLPWLPLVCMSRLTLDP